MLFIMLHEEFGLKIVHLIERTDIRHKTYLNKLSGINRIKTVKQGIYHEIVYYISLLQNNY